MIKNYLLLGIFLSICTGIRAQVISKCPASPDAVTVRQADGSAISLIGKGNILIHYTETIDGYNVIPNSQGIYEYAVKDQNGDFIPSGIKAHDPLERTAVEMAYLQGRDLQMRYSPEKIQDILAHSVLSGQYKQAPPFNGDTLKPIASSFPKTGKRNVLVILIQYPDLKATYTAQDFKDMMTKKDYKGFGSFRDFYLKNSFGKLDLNVDVVGWFTADSSYKFYGNNQGQDKARYLIAQALDSAEATGVDFSKYDNDGDGKMDGILVVHAGPGAEEGAQGQYIWSHRWSLGSLQRKYDGVTIDDYVINPEMRGGINGRMVGIGVYCHEFGHLFGLPDLYDITYNSEGVGNWALMGAGEWLNNEYTPASFCAWSKSFLGWITPVPIDSDGYYRLKPAARDSLVYKVSTPSAHEYYLIENKQYIDFDSKLNGRGLAIWHVDDSILTLTLPYNTVNANAANKGLDIEQADGRNDLDQNRNRGDGGDLYPGLYNNTSFEDGTTPSAKTHNGKNSYIRIFNIKQLADSSMQFGYGALPMASFSMPTSICQNATIALENNSRYATASLWQFGDGNSDTATNPVYTFTKTGTYYVKLTVKTDKGNLSTDSTQITVHPSAVADFDLSNDGRNLTITNKSLNARNLIWYWGDGTIGYYTTPTINKTYKDTGTYTIKLVAFGTAGCNDTLLKTIYLGYGASVAKLETPMVKLTAYPNPVDQNLNINLTLERKSRVQLYLYDNIGKRIAMLSDCNLPEGENTIHALLPENLGQGLYLLQANINNINYNLSIIKR